MEELSSDDNSNAAIVVLESDTKTKTIILSSHLESATEVIGPATFDCIRIRDHNILPSLQSNSSSLPTHGSETPSRTTILKSPPTSSLHSDGCQQGLHGIQTPLSSLRKEKLPESMPTSSANDVVSVPASDSSL